METFGYNCKLIGECNHIYQTRWIYCSLIMVYLSTRFTSHQVPVITGLHQVRWVYSYDDVICMSYYIYFIIFYLCCLEDFGTDPRWDLNPESSSTQGRKDVLPLHHNELTPRRLHQHFKNTEKCQLAWYAGRTYAWHAGNRGSIPATSNNGWVSGWRQPKSGLFNLCRVHLFSSPPPFQHCSISLT